jgi:hypothetical protein
MNAPKWTFSSMRGARDGAQRVRRVSPRRSSPLRARRQTTWPDRRSWSATSAPGSATAKTSVCLRRAPRNRRRSDLQEVCDRGRREAVRCQLPFDPGADEIRE